MSKMEPAFQYLNQNFVEIFIIEPREGNPTTTQHSKKIYNGFSINAQPAPEPSPLNSVNQSNTKKDSYSSADGKKKQITMI
jgi:hypothetical protein